MSKRKNIQEQKIVYRPVDALIPYARNSRTHSDEQVAQIAASIREFGWTNPVLVDGENGVIAGHGRILAARKLGLDTVPCIELAHLSETQKRAYIIADNKLAENAGWDNELLALEIGDLKLEGFDLELLGFDQAALDDLVGGVPVGSGEPGAGDRAGAGALSLADRFMIPPFSVLNAREGWWQNRKRAWISLGIRSEQGRGENGFNAAPGGSPMVSGYGPNGERMTGLKNMGRTFVKGRNSSDEMDPVSAAILEAGSGTSIFDPVLCELAYGWFCPPGGLVLDPFAGGSVRGIVAARMGRRYVGHELRPEQVAANRAQADEIFADETEVDPPVWIEGDSRNIDKTCADVDADFVFSCPPYADLEVYSDDPADLSNMPYDQFVAAYREIIAKTVARLRDDRFACFVVGEVRDKDGIYRNFVADTIQAFIDAGARYYNEAILVTAVGSLPIRAGKQFSASRKLGKTHQNVLVFVKGDPKRATEACGEVEVVVEGLDDVSDLGEVLEA